MKVFYEKTPPRPGQGGVGENLTGLFLAAEPEQRRITGRAERQRAKFRI
jgi:hypothetical protein